MKAPDYSKKKKKAMPKQSMCWKEKKIKREMHIYAFKKKKKEKKKLEMKMIRLVWPTLLSFKVKAVFKKNNNKMNFHSHTL